LTTSAADDLSVNWSRDGEWVYFSSNRDETWQVWKVHTQTGREVRITTKGGLGATESPDGRYLYYVKPEPGGYGSIWRMFTKAGREELVMDEFSGRRMFYTLAEQPNYDLVAVEHFH
jgi:Tol biopolymer transport system component